jgi:hypothetical protein
LEAARIAKRIVDLLRKGIAPHGRQMLIAILEGMCDDMAWVTLIFDAGHITVRLWTEIHRCRSLLDKFNAKIDSYAVLLFSERRGWW